MYYLSNICSLCLVSNQNLQSILSQDADGTMVEEKLRVFLLELVNFKPNITKYICNKCVETSNHIYKFRLKCLENIPNLNEYIEKEIYEPYKNSSVTIIDTKCKEENSVDLQIQDNSNICVRESKVLKNYLQNSIVLNSAFIKEETKYEFQNNQIISQGVIQIKTKETQNRLIEDTTIQQTCQQSKINVKVNSECIKDEPQYEIHGNTNVIEENNQSNSENVIKIKIEETHERLAEDNTSIVEKQEHTNNFQTPYEVFNELNEEKHIIDEDINLSSSSTANATMSEEPNQDGSDCSERLAAPPCPSPGAPEQRPFKCATCGLTFKVSYNLTRHRLTHTDHRPFGCSQCKYRSRFLFNLKQHMRTHSNERPFRCSVCARAFTQSGALTRHQRTHTGERPHSCPHCPHSSATKEDLKAHVRTHTGERPYACPHCPQAFYVSSRLGKHVKAKH